MNELVALVAQKVGISPEQATGAVSTVLGFLKQKLPGPIASQIDGALSKEGGQAGGGLGDVAKNVGGLLGK